MPTATLTGGYTYTGGGYVEGVNPDSGPESGGTDVVIYRGAGGLLDTDTVQFADGFFATNVVVIDDNTVSCRTPAHTPALVDVTLLDVAGETLAIYTAGYTFEVESPYAFPTITNIVPNHDVITGGVTVTITGTGFTPGMLVFFDDVLATSITYVSPTQYTCVVPPHEMGTAKVSMRQTI